LRVGETAPEIDHRFAVEVHADRRADFGPLVEVLCKRIEDRFELRRRDSLDVHIGTLTPRLRSNRL